MAALKWIAVGIAVVGAGAGIFLVLNSRDRETASMPTVGARPKRKGFL